MRLRLAISDDLPSLLSLYRELNNEDPQPDIGESLNVLNEILNSKHFEVVIAEHENVAVGTCYLNIIPNLTRNNAPYGVIENVVTLERLRRQGIGKKVVKFALDLAWARGCYKVMLQTGSRRESTRSFYRSCGFVSDEKYAFVARPKTEHDG